MANGFRGIVIEGRYPLFKLIRGRHAGSVSLMSPIDICRDQKGIPFQFMMSAKLLNMTRSEFLGELLQQILELSTSKNPEIVSVSKALLFPFERQANSKN